MRTKKLAIMKPVVEINIDAELIEDKIVPMNKAGKLNVIKCMFSNMRTLAKMIGYTRLDIAKTINAILKGESVDLTRLGRRYVVALFDMKSILPTAPERWLNMIDGHSMATYDNTTGDMCLCGVTSVNLRSDDIEVMACDRVGHDMPVDYCDYSEAQLLQVINHLFMNIRALATTLEAVRYDITVVLDSIATEYTNPAVEMTLADIGSIANLPGDTLFSKLHVVLDRRDNHFYVYASDYDWGKPRDVYVLPDDHLDAPIGYRLFSAPAVPPSRKILDKYKKKPSFLAE